MKVSFNQPSKNVKDQNGYGYAAKMCKESLTSLGHEVTWRDETADVEINFIQPQHWYWSGPYRIAYLPWESTEFHPGWVDDLNECDEVWTPSPVIAQWMVDAGVKKEPFVYEHGVEAAWGRVKRQPTGTFEVLHHGAEALRKGGNETIRSFMAALWDRDARLTMKMDLNNFRVHDTQHIRIKKRRLPIDELVALYQESDLLCYPSWGEGFGLAPIQAMATGMPVLITDGWAPYQRFIPEEGLIKSTLVQSPWQHHHPGKMFQPDEDDLQDKLRWFFDNRRSATEVAYETAELVHKEYNWNLLTEKAFAHLL